MILCSLFFLILLNLNFAFHVYKSSSIQFNHKPSSFFAVYATNNGLGAGSTIAENKKCRNGYEWDFKIEAGIKLSGTEVKACRENGNVNFL